MKNKFKYNKLFGRLAEMGLTREDYARAIGTSRSSLAAKLNSQRDFTQAEIAESVKVLSISKEDIPVYFFTPEVQKSKQRKRGERNGFGTGQNTY